MTELFGISITPDMMIAALAGLFVLNLIFLVLLISLFLRLARVFKGKDAKNFEDVIATLIKHKGNMEEFQKEVGKTFQNHEDRIALSIKEPHVLRFDAFHGTGEGGKQSFATALVSEEGNGMVLSSLYMRDKMRIYAKPIANFTSTFELTEEEEQALTRAKK